MLKNRESIIKLAVKDYIERNKKGAVYTVHDALYYSLEEHDAEDMSQDEWEDLLWNIEKKVNKPTFENVIKETIDSSRIEEERKRIFLDDDKIKVDRGTIGFLSGVLNNLEFCYDDHSTLPKEVKQELKDIAKRIKEIKKESE